MWCSPVSTSFGQPLDWELVPAWRTTVEDIIDRTLHLTVIYRLTLIRATERDREMLINIPVTDSCRLIEKHRKGAETQKTVTDFVPPRKTGVQLHLRPTAQEEWQTKEGQKGEQDRSNFHWRETETGTKSRHMGVCVFTLWMEERQVNVCRVLHGWYCSNRDFPDPQERNWDLMLLQRELRKRQTCWSLNFWNVKTKT